MNILYNDKTDLLYIRLDDRRQDVINRRVSEDIVLDIGENERVIGIEIIDASKHVNISHLRCGRVGVRFIEPAMTGVINVAPTRT